MGYTIIHATHEAVQKVGGIGAVLQGLLTARAYQGAVERSILVGPWLAPEEEDGVARDGEVCYSSVSGIGQGDVARALSAVADRHNVNLLYGTRPFRNGDGVALAEVLLVDAADVNVRMTRNFKYQLYRHFGLQSDRYEKASDYLLYLYIAEAAYDALSVLIGDAPGPHIVLAHEYMGMPLALKTMMAADARYRAIFYAHEVSTMRGLVEGQPGHDTMFYNALWRARDAGLSVADVFGDRSDFYRHALVSLAPCCDGIFAVGDPVVDELRFMGPSFRDASIDLVYNGIPAPRISIAEKRASRARLQQYAENLLGYWPDVVMMHVTRPVVSKGVWRDLQVLEHLDRLLAAQGKTGVFFVLTSAAGVRAVADVARMETEYGWPVYHRFGAPDLMGGEADIWVGMAGFNDKARAVRAVLVNQFGWDRATCGTRMPEDMIFADARTGTDLEFGLSIYEPFGISVLEPLCFGAVCVPSAMCGCCGFLNRVTGGNPVRNAVVGDYTALDWGPDLNAVRRIGYAERHALETKRAEQLAWRIMACLPQTEDERDALLSAGCDLAEQMSWERVCTDFFLPGLARAVARRNRGNV